MEEKKVVKSKEPPEDAEDWLEYINQEERKTPERLEDAAKFLATMIAISLSIFTAVSKAGGVQGVQVFKWPAGIALFAWLLSLLFAFLVLFPFRYRCLSTSVKSIKAMHRRVVRIKWVLLILSSFLFFAALCILVVRLL
jgi:hypothetical protein